MVKVEQGRRRHCDKGTSWDSSNNNNDKNNNDDECHSMDRSINQSVILVIVGGIVAMPNEKRRSNRATNDDEHGCVSSQGCRLVFVAAVDDTGGLRHYILIPDVSYSSRVE